MRYLLMVIFMLIGAVNSVNAQIGISIGFPGVSIGINLPVYPQLVQVPGYPVYYAPQLRSNYFFYDGMYWAYQGDEWYASSWYNGPWDLISRDFVPLFVLRVPVRYYRDPPRYFRGWRNDAPPRWGEHWGNDWQQQRRGWDQWDHRAVPRAAPLPAYQRQYSGDRYPRAEQQHDLRNQNYKYQPREAVVQQRYREQPGQRSPEPAQRREPGSNPDNDGRRPDGQRSHPVATPPQQSSAPVPRTQPPQQERSDPPKSAPAPSTPQQGSAPAPRSQPQQRERDVTPNSAPAPAPQRDAVDRGGNRQPQQGAAPREQSGPRSGQDAPDKGSSSRRQEQDRDKGEGKAGEGRSQDRGQDRNR